MRNFSIAIVLFFALAFVASAGTITYTTPLFDNYGSNSSCTSGSITTCNYNGWWSNASRQTNTWTDAGSYAGTSWISVGKSTNDSYNWGTSLGSSFYSPDFGGGWNSADYYNQYIGNWTGSSLNTDGYANSWGGSDTQTNHTILNSIFAWSCTGAKCHQDNWWWSSNQYDYSGSGWWASTLFGSYYDSGQWSNIFSNFTTDYGHSSFDWDRYGSPSGVPEPATNALIAVGLIAFAAFRRPWRTRTGLPSRSGKRF